MRRPSLKWPTLPGRAVSDVLAGHSAVALALGAAIYLVCLTGTLCVFMDELQLWEAPSPVPAAFNEADSEQVIASAIAAAGGPSKTPVVFLRGPARADERAVVSIGERQWGVAADGTLVPLHLAWTGFLERLHYTLTLPPFWGEFIVGMLGVALFSLLLSGVLAHPRILRDAFMLRIGGSPRLQEADLHNRMGVWGLPFHLAVTLTGALFGLASVVFVAIGATGFHGDANRAAQPYEGPKVVAGPRLAPLPPLAKIVAKARPLKPGSRLSYFAVSRPGTKGAEVSVEVTAPGRLPRGDVFYFDQTGRRIGQALFASGDAGLQLYSGAAEVHFGAFGGLPVRLAYGVLGWTLTWICASGTRIWLARRRDRGRPAPRLEKAWSALVWGAPTALTLAALGPPTQMFWLSLAALLALSQSSPFTALSSQTFDRVCRVGLATVLLLAGAVHLPQSLHSVVASVVEAGLLVAAALTTAPFWVGMRRRV